MVEIYENLFIGSADDYEKDVRFREGWEVVHACREPYHRRALGYTGRGAPKHHPEYLIARRENRIILNLIDAGTPKYIPKEIIDASLEFISTAIAFQHKCLVHCNQGFSRAPSLGFLFLASKGLLSENFDEAFGEFLQLYPYYNPGNGMYCFVKDNWNSYCRKIEI